MSIRMFTCGCDYPGESYSLPDCSKDAQALVATFEKYIASVTVLLNRKAPLATAVKALLAFYDSCKAGDFALLAFSGHGTSDEIDGKRVEGIVLNDGKVLYEAKLRQIINTRPRGVIAAMLSDSCYSGLLPKGNHQRTPRTVAASKVTWPEFDQPARMPVQPNAAYLGCSGKKGDEYSYSTGDGGAMTLATIAAFNESEDRTTLKALHTKIRKRLPTKEWPQTPVFFCRDAALAKRTIKSFVA